MRCLVFLEEGALAAPFFMNEKTPVISRSLFINQKTNSHDKLL